jgi:NTP pyrophosphatase (non-canonical NTP hydrolase)
MRHIRNPEYLHNLFEECAEVVVAGMKGERFGWDDHHPDYHEDAMNEEALIQEIGDVLAIIELLGVDHQRVLRARDRKMAKMEIYGPHGTYLTSKRVKRVET